MAGTAALHTAGKLGNVRRTEMIKVPDGLKAVEQTNCSGCCLWDTDERCPYAPSGLLLCVELAGEEWERVIFIKEETNNAQGT
jgi:hypothetical protein